LDHAPLNMVNRGRPITDAWAPDGEHVEAGTGTSANHPGRAQCRIDATTRSEASLRVCCRRQLLDSGHELDAIATIAYLRADGVVAAGLAPGDMEPQLRTARCILGCVDHLAEGLDYFEGS